MLLGPQMVDAAVLLVLSGLAGFFFYKHEEKNILALKDELKTLRTDLTAFKKESDEVRSHVGSLSLGMNLRKNNPISNKPS